MTTRLTPKTFAKAVQDLARKDLDLKRVVSKFGPPRFWQREEGFPTLIYIILEQQVSIASAKAVYRKLLDETAPLTPRKFLDLSESQLRRVGFSRQKTAYGRTLAEAVARGDFAISALPDLDDARAKRELVKLKGIGSWTADIYLLTALGRPDIWPSGDLALALAVQKLKSLPSRPTPEELNTIALDWKPWRAVAARILWHYYLSERNREK